MAALNCGGAGKRRFRWSIGPGKVRGPVWPSDSGVPERRLLNERPAREGGRVIGINQIVFDTFTNSLHVESDELLDQHTRYALIATRGVRDREGICDWPDYPPLRGERAPRNGWDGRGVQGARP